MSSGEDSDTRSESNSAASLLYRSRALRGVHPLRLVGLLGFEPAPTRVYDDGPPALPQPGNLVDHSSKYVQLPRRCCCLNLSASSESFLLASCALLWD